jgi:hypothetical protein
MSYKEELERKIETVERKIVTVLEDAPKYGYNVHTIGTRVAVSEMLVLAVLHSLADDSRVRRTPNTCLRRLS